MRRHTLYAGAMAVALLIGAGTPPVAAEDMPQVVSQAALLRTLLPTVVNIAARAEIPTDTPTTQQATARTPGPSYQLRVNAGSGFVIDPSGLIATNWHVVDGAFEIRVTFSDGSVAQAKLVQAARTIDLALIRVDVGHTLPTIKWGDSSKVQVGDPVLAVGNALGVGMSVSSGIVSALNRNISDTPYDDFIQTDAAINHGNSGGPLFNLQGEVIGVNSAIISPTAANAGLGFSLPSNDAHAVFERLSHPGAYTRPAWLGAKVQAVSPEMAEAMGIKEQKGVIVAAVLDGGPAQKAGLQPGDIIVRFAGTEPTDDRALLRQIAMAKAGSAVTIRILRDGAPMDIDVTLGAWPQMMWERNAAPPVHEVRMTVPDDLGLTMATLTDALRVGNHIPAQVNGVMVTGVEPGTDASHRGITAGDVVLRVGSHPVATSEQLRREIEQARAQGRTYGMFLIYPKKQPNSNTKYPGPSWMALRVAAG